MQEIETAPQPQGTLALQIIAMPKDTNGDGDIFGGWLVSQMDLAAAITAKNLAHGRVATVAIGDLAFMQPVYVGATVSCYTEVLEVGRSSMQIAVEVWIPNRTTLELSKVTDGIFVFVAIDDKGRTRTVK